MQNPHEPGVGIAGASCLVGSGNTNNYGDPILTNQPADSARPPAEWRRDCAKNDEPPSVLIITQHAGGISHTYTLILTSDPIGTGTDAKRVS